MIRLLGIDQSTKCSGYCVMENGKYKKSGVIEVSDKDDTMTRLENMNKEIIKLIRDVKPTWVIFENIQFQRNYQTYKTLAQLQGLIMAYLFQKDLGFTIVEPTAWKSCCGIKGKKRIEQKMNTQKYVEDTYGVSVGEDEADSIGITTWAIKNLAES